MGQTEFAPWPEKELGKSPIEELEKRERKEGKEKREKKKERGKIAKQKYRFCQNNILISSEKKTR